MISPPELEGRLRRLSQELRQRGQLDLADEVTTLATALDQPDAAGPGAADWLTTGPAARALGVRSINTIKRWAREGRLDGVRRGGRLLVSAASVQRLLRSPLVATQRAREEELAAALAPLDAGDVAIPATTTWTGSVPWTRPADGAR